MQALLKLPVPSNRESSLRNFYDKMEIYIRTLEAMEQCQESYGNLLVPVVLKKMPGEICRQLARENCANKWKLEELRQSTEKSASWRLAPCTATRESILTWLRCLFTQERDNKQGT